jgi:predicted GNAT family N-acyltransferase
MARAIRIRRRVFIEEQGVPEEIELDADDRVAIHVIAVAGRVAVGCARMVIHNRGDHDDWVKIGRMAVMPQCRRRGVGRAMLTWLLTRAAALGARRAVLHAQVHAEGFYLQCGFNPVGEIFDEAGIAHRRMELGMERALDRSSLKARRSV